MSAYWKFPLGELPLENNLGSPFSSRRLYSCPSSLGPLPAWKRKVNKLINYPLLEATISFSVVCQVARTWHDNGLVSDECRYNIRRVWTSNHDRSMDTYARSRHCQCDYSMGHVIHLLKLIFYRRTNVCQVSKLTYMPTLILRKASIDKRFCRRQVSLVVCNWHLVVRKLFLDLLIVGTSI